MTELYIDNRLAVLPADFTATIKDENSFFTKNGEYSYDIELKMDNPINQQIFGYINRENRASVAKYDYTCRLVVDHRLVCNGTLTVTEPCSGYLKAQILSGNSELNYFIGSDLLISSLDLGVITLTENNVKVDALQKGYPDMDFCLCPIVNKTTGMIYNGIAGTRTGSTAWTDNVDYYIPQPFLLSMMKKIITALGYTIGTCEPDSSDYANLYISHLNRTRKYAEMLPGWKVKDFLEEVEKLLNVEFYLDNRKKTVDIVFASTFYINSARQHVQNVIDDWEGQKDDSNRVEHSQCDIEYDLPEETYFKRQLLAADLLAKFTLKHFPTTAEAVAWVKGGCGGSSTSIAVANDFNRMIAYIPSERAEGSGMVIPQEPVDTFRRIDIADTDETITCKMIPVAMELQYFPLMRANDRSDVAYLVRMPQLTGDSSDSEEADSSSSDTASAIDQIDNYKEASVASISNISLAFFAQGKNNTFYHEGMYVYYVLPWTDAWTANNFPCIMNKKDGSFVHMKDVTGSLRLELIAADIYQHLYQIDSEHPRIFYSEDINFFDSRKIFIIRNKRYVCKELEYTINASGRVRKWKGTFYPITISDTDVNRRWVLADGKWRDAGIWLDDGRWLDS